MVFKINYFQEKVLQFTKTQWPAVRLVELMLKVQSSLTVVPVSLLGLAANLGR